MTPGDRFYEWLLSDHPEAAADRDAPENLRELAATARWLLTRQAERQAADAAEPEAERLARMRRDFENSRRAQGASSYRYPARYLGARAARQPIPPDPDRLAAGEEPS